MVASIQDILPILRCPRTHTRLILSNGRLISEAGEEYPILGGKPILIKYPRDINLNPPPQDKISQNQPSYSVPEAFSSSNRVLHLGSGNIPCSDPRVVSLDALPDPNVDVVAEAEELPFLDNTFDYVESSAVFEHVYDPILAIKEVKRILRSTGVFRIDTAFMQSYHGFPAHYFNMTPQADETYLLDDFVMEESYVPDSATPLKSLLDLIERFLSYLPEKEKVKLMSCSFQGFLHMIKSDTTRKNTLLSSFSEYALRSMAAGYVVTGRKPHHWKDTVEKMRGQKSVFDEWNIWKREYYTARMEVMLRHHEVLFYKRLCQERGASPQNISDPDPVDSILAGCKVLDPLSIASIRKSVNDLCEAEQVLRRARDQWISKYMHMPASEQERALIQWDQSAPTMPTYSQAIDPLKEDEGSLIVVAYRYLRRRGIKKFLAATLMYLSRKFGEVSVETADRFVLKQ